MRKSATLLAGLSLLALAACSTGSEEEVFTASLTGGAAVPVSANPGTGTVQVTSDGVALAKYTVSLANISGVSSVHIHNGGPTAQTNTVQVYLFDGPTTTGAVNGQLVRSTFTQSTIAAAGSNTQYGTLIDNMRSHAAYVDVHTEASPTASVIRGNF